MEGEEQFYVTLPSNSSFDYFPDNTVTSFKTKLAAPLIFHAQWEVALVEIIYPYSWYNVNITNNTFQFLLSEEVASHCVIPEGHYKDIGSICEALTAALPERFRNNFTVQRDSSSGKVIFDFDQVSAIQLSEGLGYLLGFPRGIIRGHAQAPFSPNVNGGINTLYLYTDVICNQPVGDISAPLLRIVPVPHRRAGEIVTFTYQTPHYLPVKSKYIDTIQVDIRSDFGEKVPFQSGKLVIKLHFRACRYLH